MAKNLAAALAKANKSNTDNTVNTASAVAQREQERQSKASVKPPSRADAEQFSCWVSKPAKQQLKILAIELNTTQQALGVEAMNMLFAKYSKPEIAKPLTEGSTDS